MESARSTKISPAVALDAGRLRVATFDGLRSFADSPSKLAYISLLPMATSNKSSRLILTMVATTVKTGRDLDLN